MSLIDFAAAPQLPSSSSKDSYIPMDCTDGGTLAGQLDGRTLSMLLVARRLRTVENTVPLSSLGDGVDPFGHTNLAQDPMGIDQKPLEYRNRSPVTQLNLACQAMFGRTNGIIEWTYTQLATQPSTSCTLTIERPVAGEGACLIRSYSSKPEYATNKDAQRAVAQFALDMGAVDFLQRGDDQEYLDRALANHDGESTEPGVVKTIWGTVYSQRVDIAGSGEAVALTKDVNEIDRCCSEWRTGKVAPHWLITGGRAQALTKYGALLQIKLSPIVSKVWSVPNTYALPTEAKNAVAAVAMKEGVLEFIRHGNGQQQPNQGPQEDIPPLAAASSHITVNVIDPSVHPTSNISLTNFLNTLPNPLPNNVGLMPGQMNPIAWVNQIVHHAALKVPGFNVIYSFVPSINGKGHGCIVRVEAPSIGSQSWFADAIFTTRQDARTAACLYAIGAGGFDEYVRSATARYFARPVSLEVECQKHGFEPPRFNFTRSGKNFGAVLTIAAPSKGLSQNFSVNPTYASAPEAQAAVLSVALRDGALQFVQKQVAPKAKARRTGKKENNRSGDVPMKGSVITGANRIPLKRPASSEFESTKKKLKVGDVTMLPPTRVKLEDEEVSLSSSRYSLPTTHSAARTRLQDSLQPSIAPRAPLPSYGPSTSQPSYGPGPSSSSSKSRWAPAFPPSDRAPYSPYGAPSVSSRPDPYGPPPGRPPFIPSSSSAAPPPFIPPPPSRKRPEEKRSYARQDSNPNLEEGELSDSDVYDRRGSSYYPPPPAAKLPYKDAYAEPRRYDDRMDYNHPGRIY